MNYKITVNPEKDLMPYNENEPYYWYISKWNEIRLSWEDVKEDHSESPEQAFKDAMEHYNKLIENKGEILK
ncbi:hypothetical protein [Metabacillus fastidiosus]|uniref:hypothetical protein n=1 Tax=Metabacillus fastidiosus TaxID=1458 RepID=UPI003D27CDA0